MEKKTKDILKIILKAAIFIGLFIATTLICKKFTPEILNLFSTTGSKILLWILIICLSGIIPGPFMPVVVFCNSTNLLPGTAVSDLWGTTSIYGILFIWSAVILGKILSYALGMTLGKRCCKWILTTEENYTYWYNKLNTNQGLLIYSLTVALPFFPDYLLAYIAGSLKIKFWVYLLVNMVCKLVDIIVVLCILRSGII